MAKQRTAADLLRRLREESGRSLRNAAEELSIAPSQLSRIETGQRGLSESMAGRIAGFYDVDADLLLLAEGQLPKDVIEILMNHPQEISRLRRLYGASLDKGA